MRLRYVPDEFGERVNAEGRRYKKYDFAEAYDFISRRKPQYAGLLHHVPHGDVKRVLKPDHEIGRIAARHPKVQKLVSLFSLPEGAIGCTGSLLCGLENESSDIDMVVYGRHWFDAQARVREGIRSGTIDKLSGPMWRKVYEKRRPEIELRGICSPRTAEVEPGANRGNLFRYPLYPVL